MVTPTANNHYAVEAFSQLAINDYCKACKRYPCDHTLCSLFPYTHSDAHNDTQINERPKTDPPHD